MSTHYLALDIGSTTVVAIVIDLDTNAVVGAASTANLSEVTSRQISGSAARSGTSTR